MGLLLNFRNPIEWAHNMSRGCVIFEDTRFGVVRDTKSRTEAILRGPPKKTDPHVLVGKAGNLGWCTWCNPGGVQGLAHRQDPGRGGGRPAIPFKAKMGCGFQRFASNNGSPSDQPLRDFFLTSRIDDCCRLFGPSARISNPCTKSLIMRTPFIVTPLTCVPTRVSRNKIEAPIPERRTS